MLDTLFSLLLIYLGIMAGFTALTMMTAYCLARDRFADPEFATHFTRTYPPGALKAAWRDFWAISRYYLLYPIGFFMRDPDENLQSDDELPPVLFVHGWTETRATWAPYLKRLRLNPRRKLYALTFWPPDAPLERYAGQLDRKAADVLSRTRHKRLVLVGHSMGGILARDYVRRHGAESVERVITIASPHQGTLWGYVALGRSVAQMTTRCPYLAELAQDEAIRRVDVHCIASVHDNLVIPFDNALLPGAHHHLLVGHGHVSVTGAPETLKLVERLLYDDPAAAPPVARKDGPPQADAPPSAVPDAPEAATAPPKATTAEAESPKAATTKTAARKPAAKAAAKATEKTAGPARSRKKAGPGSAPPDAPPAPDAAPAAARPPALDPEHREALKRKLVKKLSEG